MSNVAVSIALPIPQILTLGSNVNCPAGVATQIFATTPLVGPQSQDVAPFMFVGLGITMGATPPTALQMFFGIVGSSNFFNLPLTANLLTAAAIQVLQGMAWGVKSQSAWLPPGAQLQVTVNPSGQAVTVNSFNSFAYAGLWLG